MTTGVAQSAGLPGHAGAHILRKETGDEVEFVLITYWTSWEAVQRFAGVDVSVAVLYPGDENFELIPSKTVDHHQVVFASQP
nr:hypothetical protein [Kribbella sp. VKM Ac-2566]